MKPLPGTLILPLKEAEASPESASYSALTLPSTSMLYELLGSLILSLTSPSIFASEDGIGLSLFALTALSMIWDRSESLPLMVNRSWNHHSCIRRGRERLQPPRRLLFCET